MSDKKFETITIERNGAAGIVRLNVPATLNAMTTVMFDELNGALDEFEREARAFILTGTGRAFSSGWDLSQGDLDAFLGSSYDAGMVLETHINSFMTRLRNSPLPFVTVVNGVAAGAGCSLALSGDLVIASESAYFLQAFSRIGLVPDAGATHLLVRAVGRVRAMEMMLLADKVPAAKALEWGLVNKVVPDQDLEGEALAIVERLAKGPRSLTLTRQMAWAAIDGSWDDMLKLERVKQQEAGLTSDHKEGVDAFLKKRSAEFKGE